MAAGASDSDAARAVAIDRLYRPVYRVAWIAAGPPVESGPGRAFRLHRAFKP
jgi:hypothetical protein